MPLPQAIWTCALIAISGLALWQGGRPERIVSVANLAAFWGTLALENRENFFDLQWGILLVDALFLAILGWLAVTTNRTWLLFAAAFQLLAVVIHVAIMVESDVRSLAYFRGLIIWSCLVLASLGVGTWQCWRMRRRYGAPDPAAGPG